MDAPVMPVSSPPLETPTSGSTPATMARSWRYPFGAITSREDIGREVLAGILGWLTVVSSVGFCEYSVVLLVGQMHG